MRIVKIFTVLMITVIFLSGNVFGVVAIKNIKYVDGKITEINLDKGTITINEKVTLVIPQNRKLPENIRVGVSGRFFYEDRGKLKIFKTFKKITEDKCGGPK